MNTKIIKVALISNDKFEICRLCGKKSLNCISIFEDRNNYILEKISRCLPIIVFPNDNLPSSVCRRCLNYLNISCKLILTAIEVDKRLRMQLDLKQKVSANCKNKGSVSTNKDTVFTNKDTYFTNKEVTASCDGPVISAIAGSVGCDLCDLHFQNIDIVDTNQIRFFKWKCSLCDSSFDKSSELIAHKSSKHNGNIMVCNKCRCTYGQNVNTDEMNNKQNTKRKIINEKVQNNQINAQEIMNKTNNKQKITNKNVQNDKQEITSEKNIQNNQQTEQETIDKNNYERIVSKNDEIGAFINLTMDENDIAIKDKNVDFDKMHVSIEETDDSFDLDKIMDNDDTSDSETDRIVEQYKRIFERIKTTQNEQLKRFFCDTCKIFFESERHFNAHNRIHEEKVVTCTKCSTKCSSVHDLFLHKREKHNMYKNSCVKYACSKCGKFFTHSWTWESHKEDQCFKTKKKFCKYCNVVFPTQLKLTRHLRSHKWEMLNDPDVTVYKCVSCPKEFIDKEFYEKHRNVHDPECWNKYRCATCKKPFRDGIRLHEHHMAVHQNIKPYQCHVCGRFFLRSQSLKIHSRIHSGHNCNRCNKVFEKRVDLTKHLQETHGLKLPSKPNLNKDYICRYCGKKLRSYISLTDHERIHTGEKPYNCSKCERSFRSYTARWTHLQHHLKSMFVCEHCGKSYSYKRSLALHTLTHLPMEDRKYECNICKKRFMRNAHLIIHQRIHSGIRPYKCDVCLVSFTQKGDMVRHRMRHFNKDKPVKKR
ncbi:zinc finger protein 852-like isoform X3 [Solenopsis invicta]|uniref:zinc finger protein 852-like isoform X3 n=1 Tax=Solenopsis invicta TaxID=13686 RepID=UPI000E340377|nr:zinc finger protein 852-like isoform X3 [Solenopsis invicta]